MKKKYIRRNILLISFAVVMILSAGIGHASAYFTTFARAAGGYVIPEPPHTDIKEKVSDWVKEVTISNRSGSLPVYIRVKAFCGGEYDLAYADPSGKWSMKSDGYWYYNDMLSGGKETEPLSVRIEKVPISEEGVAAKFNVVVIYESTPVRYDNDGNPYMDWSDKLDSGRVEGGN